MSIRALHVPTAETVDDDAMVPSAVPVDDHGTVMIPELNGREPTHNEQQIISGEPISMASSNVQEIFWNWQNRKLFVKFLSGDLYVYHDVPLSVVVGMVETPSAGRYVWNVLRDVYDFDRLEKGSGPRKKPQVVRLLN